MNRWMRLAAAVTVAISVTSCGAKLVVVPVSAPPPESSATTPSAGTKPTNGDSSTHDGGTQPAQAKMVMKSIEKSSSKLADEGVFYALPKTVARVVVKVDKDTKQFAPYSRFTPIFAPGAEPVCGTIVKCRAKKDVAKEAEYSLEQGATFSTFGEPDPDEIFLVKFTGGGALDQTLSMEWNETGLLSTASASVTNRTTDIVMSGLKLLTSLATKAVSVSTNASTKSPSEPDQCKTNGGANDAWILPILRGATAAKGANDDSNPMIRNYCGLPNSDRPGRTDEDSRDDFIAAEDKDDLVAARDAYDVRLAELVRQRTSLLTSSTVNVLDPVKYLEKVETVIDQ
jgi:hypothetical protein